MYCLKYNYSQACKSATGPPRLFHGKSSSVLHNKNKYPRLINSLKPDFFLLLLILGLVTSLILHNVKFKFTSLQVCYLTMEAGPRTSLLASLVNLFADTGQFPIVFLTIMQHLGSKSKGFHYIQNTHYLSITNCL